MLRRRAPAQRHALEPKEARETVQPATASRHHTPIKRIGRPPMLRHYRFGTTLDHMTQQPDTTTAISLQTAEPVWAGGLSLADRLTMARRTLATWEELHQDAVTYLALLDPTTPDADLIPETERAVVRCAEHVLEAQALVATLEGGA